MYGVPVKDIAYCKYEMPYQIRTRLWNNVFQWIHKHLCKKVCGQISNNKHITTAQKRTRLTMVILTIHKMNCM